MNEYNLRSDDAIEQRSSTGWLMKWRLGKIWVKSPGFVGNSFVWDSYSEILAYNISKDLEIKRHLQYEPCIINLDNSVKLLGCESKDFNRHGYNEITLYKLMKIGYFNNNNCNLYDNIICSIKKQFKLNIQSLLEDIIVLDSVILNGDRQLWNISILISNNAAIEAPIYDSGSSLGLNTYRSGEFFEGNTYIDLLGYRSQPFYDTFEEQLKLVRKNRKYNWNINRIIKIINYIENNFTKNNNTFGVINTLDNEQIKYIKTLLNARLNVTKGIIDG